MLVHKAFPEITETIKWGFPHFEYKGIVCSMAAFKSHCTFGFWKAAMMKEVLQKANRTGQKGMGQFGRIRKKSDLPSDTIMLRWIREAVEINENPAKAKLHTGKIKKKTLVIPLYIRKALSENKNAQANFRNLNISQKNDYISWISEAKLPETRNKRLLNFIRRVSEGKTRKGST
jgi:uncharacterized protein YdeI (YjbR/CyaY-like superfamily)